MLLESLALISVLVYIAYEERCPVSRGDLTSLLNKGTSYNVCWNHLSAIMSRQVLLECPGHLLPISHHSFPSKWFDLVEYFRNSKESPCWRLLGVG